MRSKVLAIDFDGTLCTNNYPYIGKPNIELIERLKREKEYGTKLILWTCRDGKQLAEAVETTNETKLSEVYTEVVNIYQLLQDIANGSYTLSVDVANGNFGSL